MHSLAKPLQTKPKGDFMKKIIPIALLTIGGILTGCTNLPQKTDYNLQRNVQAFKEDINDYCETAKINEISKLNKYTVAIKDDLEQNTLTDLSNGQSTIETQYENELNLLENQEMLEHNTSNQQEDNNETEELDADNLKNEEDYEQNSNTSNGKSQISTLYSLSNDINNSCDEFCVLKQNIQNAINETQCLIDKVQSKELELTREQRMFLTEQTSQLKKLGSELKNITTELNFNLSDIATIMNSNNQDIDNISLKYMIVLDNLINGNEMLQNGLNSLYLINSMMNVRTPIAPNNYGRILYGYQTNNNPPIIKDYYIDENNELKENTQTSEEENAQTEENVKTTAGLNPNIDTYGNANPNIDTFFNTAWLDNGFMNGGNPNMYAGGYGYNNGFYGGNNGVYGGNNNYIGSERNTTYSRELENNTPNVDTMEKRDLQKSTKKKFKLKKNLDTYKDENTPTIKERFSKIKINVQNFFQKFSRPNDKTENPVITDTEETEN